MSRVILDTQAAGIKTPDTQRIMLLVLAALIPGTMMYAWFISPMVLFNIAFAMLFAVVIEIVALQLRGQTIKAGIHDGSIALAAALLALAVPPMLPFWQLLIGVFIMVMLGKQVYGGLGQNPFNPAMVGYAALLISFPQSMTLWFAPELMHALDLSTLFNSKLSLSVISSNPSIGWDSMTRATPLEHVRTLRMQSPEIVVDAAQVRNMASVWLWVSAGFLIGGLFLLQQRVIQWHIPVSVLGGFALCTILFSTSELPLLTSFYSGALIVGAFFIATDPVTAASSRRGRLVFGAGIGVITFIIREFGGYPEGFAFAVLLMNLSVPLIDHLELQLAKPS